MAIRINNKQLNMILQAGQQMSNICFNLSQRESLPDRERQSMRECQEAWDAAYPRKRVVTKTEEPHA